MVIATKICLDTCNMNCSYCVTGDTKILMKNYIWKDIKDVKVGDELIAFDEESKKLKESEVLRTFVREDEPIKIETNKSNLKITKEHPFLNERGNWTNIEKTEKYGRGETRIRHFINPNEFNISEEYKKGYIVGIIEGDGTIGNYFPPDGYERYFFRIALSLDNLDALKRLKRYLHTIDIDLEIEEFKSNSEWTKKEMNMIRSHSKDNIKKLNKLINSKNNSKEFKRGWLAGHFDAEGSSSGNIRYSQYNEELKNKIIDYANDFDLDFKKEKMGAYWCGKFRERFFSIIQPAISNKIKVERKNKYESELIKNKEKLGKQKVYNLETTTGTYIANGFLVHNCYQTPENKIEQHPRDYDIESVMKGMEEVYEKTGSDITLHSGEPTALHPDDLEKLLKKSYELTGESSIQTNGYRVDEYWDLFEKYNTSLGFSYDGYGRANILRGYGDEEKRLQIADKVADNIDEALDRGLRCSVIAIIHKINGIEHFDKLKEFLVDHPNVTGRLNPVSVTKNIDEKPSYEPTIKEFIEIYDKLYDVVTEHGLNYSPFRDMGNNLRNNDEIVCVFGESCDIYCTEALYGIDKKGTHVNCIKTYHNDVIYPRADESRSDIRKQVLRETDCKGCKWFDYCKGGCPNDGINDDWRRKSRYCELYKHLFQKIENALNAFGGIKKEECKTDFKYDEDYSDGIRHEDGDMVHLDSGGKNE